MLIFVTGYSFFLYHLEIMFYKNMQNFVSDNKIFFDLKHKNISLSMSV